MSNQAMESKRFGARIIGVIFQFLAVVTLGVTIIVMIDVSDAGSSIGIPRSHNAVIWIIGASGLFVTLVFAGFGHALGMLCAIYDRQDSIIPTTEVVGTAMRRSTFPTPPPPVESRSSSPSIKDTRMWNFMTRERHFRKHRS